MTGEKNQNTWIDNTGEPRLYTGTEAAGINTAGANMPAANAAWNQAASGALQAPQPGAAQGGYAVVQGRVPAETRETKRMKENYGFIAPAAIAYAVFYAFCMYRNDSGITYLFFVAASLLFFCLVMAKLGIIKRESADTAEKGRGEYGKAGLKKGSIFYIVIMMLLGISTFCTDDGTLIFFNKLGVFLLLMSFLLKQFYDTSGWKLGKYLGSICILVGACFGELGRPFTDGAAYNKVREKKTDKRVWYFALGVLIGLPLLLVVLLLLASADAVFRQMTEKLLQSISLAGIFNVVFRVALLFFGAYAMTAYLCKKRIKEETPDRRRGEPVLAITVTGLLTVLYLFFSVIQIAGLFLGKLQLPEGYTYALYARQGFFQLLAVSMLNLVIVLGCMNFFRESKVLKAVLVIMSICTFIMIASSCVRMIMYIRYYYLTYLRILVLWGLALLAVLFVGVIANIFKENFPLFRYSMTAVAVLYLALSVAHPDYLIARVNIANAPWGDVLLHQEGEDWTEDEFSQDAFFLAKEPYLDFAYLGTLSADAAPVLVPYLEKLGYSMEAFYAEDAVDYAAGTGLWSSGSGQTRSGQAGFGYYWMRKVQRSTKNFGIRTYNVSRHMAIKALKGN